MIRYELSADTQAEMLHYQLDDAIRFANSGCLETRQWRVQSPYFTGNIRETRHKRFDIIDTQVHCGEDCCLHTCHDGTSFLSLGIVWQGAVEFTLEHRRYAWSRLNANILVGADYEDEYNYFPGGRTFGMLNLVISTDFFHQLAETYPDWFGKAYRRMSGGETFFLLPSHQRIVPALAYCLQGFRQNTLLGNCCEMYLEAKIQEALSLFLLADADNSRCIRVAPPQPGMYDKLLHACDILTAEYLDPPTLHALALRVGTNECTLKAEFKRHFHQTVFGFLFDYRMSMAADYLRDTSHSIADIAQLTGYAYPSHFCQAFKRKYGISPSDYRKAPF